MAVTERSCFARISVRGPAGDSRPAARSDAFSWKQSYGFLGVLPNGTAVDAPVRAIIDRGTSRVLRSDADERRREDAPARP